MSLHIMYDHQCSECEAYYIPYDEDIVCPNCGKDEEKALNIVTELTKSAQYQMNTMGFYSPIAWWTGSFGDFVALLIFKVLDEFYAQKDKDFKEIAESHFNSREWGTQLYMKNHIKDLSYKVYLEIEKHK